MDITEETLNHLLKDTTIVQIALYGDRQMHIFLDFKTILTIRATDDGVLDVDILGPDAPRRGDRFGVVEENSP